MPVVTGQFSVQTNGFGDIRDITESVQRELTASGISSGIVTVFVPGSTAAVTTIEFEAGVIEDLRDSLNRLIPESARYKHNARWGDGNGFSHVRAAWIGPSLTIPVIDRALSLGTWQQVVLVDFDNRSRRREVIVQILGEKDA